MTSHDPLGREQGAPLDPFRHGYDDLIVRAAGNARVWAAVWQQSPRSVGGELIRPDWFIMIKPTQLPPEKEIKWVRAWDLAFSEKQLVKKDPDYTAGAKIGIWRKGKEFKFIISHIARWQAIWPVSRGRIRELASLDGQKTRLGIEGGTQQKGVVELLKHDKDFMKFSITSLTPVRDKVARAQGWADHAQNGSILVVEGAWNYDFFNECEIFPNGTHDDQIDAISLGHELIMKSQRAGSIKRVATRGLYT